ncbi:hypothetical protein [Alienimonas sp. DA493]|uniref:hypothetical protein n=1 Tax=Alienimonas sp. DA493 TaxID=3373605 RepID=UPI00375403A8
MTDPVPTAADLAELTAADLVRRLRADGMTWPAMKDATGASLGTLHGTGSGATIPNADLYRTLAKLCLDRGLLTRAG